MYRTSIHIPALLAVAMICTILIVNPTHSLQPETQPDPEAPQENALQDQGQEAKWDPTLQFDYPKLRERLEEIIATEDHFNFMVAYWGLVHDTHQAFPILYQGDRAVISRDFFLLPERLLQGGWILIDAADNARERERYEIPNDNGLYILRKDQVLRVGDLEDGDVVFVATKNAAGIIGVEDGGVDISVEPTVSPTQKTGD
jgi:hypothetical protein